MLEMFKLLLGLLIGFMFLQGCTTSKVSNEVPETETTTRSPLDGIWVGEFDIRGKGPYDFTAIHLNDKAYAYSLKAKTICIGTLDFDGEHSLHNYVLFSMDGGPFDWANITGTLKNSEQDQYLLASHFRTLNGGDTGALNIAYDNVYEQPSSLLATQGRWSYTDRDDLTTDVTIDEKGVLSGSDTDGCGYLGYVDIINAQYNVYQVKVEISECGSVNGEYEGVSYLVDEIFTLQIANPQYALYYAFDRK